MSNQSLSVKVHSGNATVFSRSFPAGDAGRSSTAGALVTSLREAQAAVNQFLTELVVKSDGQGTSCDKDEEISDDDDEEEEEEVETSETKNPESVHNVSGKRKADKNGSSPATSDRQEKRNKT